MRNDQISRGTTIVSHGSKPCFATKGTMSRDLIITIRMYFIHIFFWGVVTVQNNVSNPDADPDPD